MKNGKTNKNMLVVKKIFQKFKYRFLIKELLYILICCIYLLFPQWVNNRCACSYTVAAIIIIFSGLIVVNNLFF